MFEWDPAKAAANQRKHGVAFADTFAVFEDGQALTTEQAVRGEERWITLGRDAYGRLLVVVYTWRGDCIRLISARLATHKEQQEYES